MTNLVMLSQMDFQLFFGLGVLFLFPAMTALSVLLVYHWVTK